MDNLTSCHTPVKRKRGRPRKGEKKKKSSSGMASACIMKSTAGESTKLLSVDHTYANSQCGHTSISLREECMDRKCSVVLRRLSDNEILRACRSVSEGPTIVEEIWEKSIPVSVINRLENVCYGGFERSSSLCKEITGSKTVLNVDKGINVSRIITSKNPCLLTSNLSSKDILTLLASKTTHNDRLLKSNSSCGVLIQDFSSNNFVNHRNIKIKISRVETVKTLEYMETDFSEVPVELDTSVNSTESEISELNLNSEVLIQQNSSSPENVKNYLDLDHLTDEFVEQVATDTIKKTCKSVSKENYLSSVMDVLDSISILAIMDLRQNPHSCLDSRIQTEKSHLDSLLLLSTEKIPTPEKKEKIASFQYTLQLLNTAKHFLSLHGSFSKVSDAFLSETKVNKTENEIFSDECNLTSGIHCESPESNRPLSSGNESEGSRAFEVLSASSENSFANFDSHSLSMNRIETLQPTKQVQNERKVSVLFPVVAQATASVNDHMEGNRSLSSSNESEGSRTFQVLSTTAENSFSSFDSHSVSLNRIGTLQPAEQVQNEMKFSVLFPVVAQPTASVNDPMEGTSMETQFCPVNSETTGSQSEDQSLVETENEYMKVAGVSVSSCTYLQDAASRKFTVLPEEPLYTSEEVISSNEIFDIYVSNANYQLVTNSTKNISPDTKSTVINDCRVGQNSVQTNQAFELNFSPSAEITSIPCDTSTSVITTVQDEPTEVPTDEMDLEVLSVIPKPTGVPADEIDCAVCLNKSRIKCKKCSKVAYCDTTCEAIYWDLQESCEH